jgi:hypothetical protein
MSPSDADTAPQFSQDAAIVFALARTAMPFAGSFHEQAERWLRLLRAHGEVGATLQALGVGEAPLDPASDEHAVEACRGGGPHNSAGVVELVCMRGFEFARSTGADTVGTVHILFAVLSVYGAAFDHELYRRGVSRDEIFERLSRESSVEVPD